MFQNRLETLWLPSIRVFIFSYYWMANEIGNTFKKKIGIGFIVNVIAMLINSKNSALNR